MVIAVLALLGVDLIVVVALLVIMASRRRWVRSQPGVFPGSIRIVRGEMDGLNAKWRKGYGRWVRDVMVWTKAPLLFRNELFAVDELVLQRQAEAGEFSRSGDNTPTVARFLVGEATVEIASVDTAALLRDVEEDAAG